MTMTISLDSLQPKNRWRENQSCYFDYLRPKAQRLIESLHRRMKASGKGSLYLEEIKKVVLYEQDQKKKKVKPNKIY